MSCHVTLGHGGVAARLDVEQWCFDAHTQTQWQSPRRGHFFEQQIVCTWIVSHPRQAFLCDKIERVGEVRIELESSGNK